MVAWHLKFLVEDPEAELRFRHTFSTFQNDLHVAHVEESVDAAEPSIRVLTIQFAEGHTKPQNQALANYDKVFGSTPIQRRTLLERLMEGGLLEDDSDET